MTIRQTKIYLICLLLGSIFTILAFYVLVDIKALPNKTASQIDYRNMLLEGIQTPRIIIDSGSNSFWSIIPQIIEEKFRIPTIVVAENGNVPFDMKVNRLKTYVRSGDIILLPLEWIYYSRKEYTSNFMDSVFGITKSNNLEHNILYNYTYHYYLLHAFDRIKFIFKHVNPTHILKSLIQRYNEPSIHQQLSIRTSALLFNYNNNPAGDVKNDANRLHDSTLLSVNCQQYLNANPLNDTSVLNEIVHSLSEFKKIHNVKIIITWPAVAGKECYIEDRINKFVSQITEASELNGLIVTGSPYESFFPEIHMLDTYYHVDSKAALLRTNRLVANLEKLIVVNSNINDELNTKSMAHKALVDKLNQIQQTKISFLQPIKTGEYKVNSPDFDTYFNLSDTDWYPTEGWGRWSRGELSKIVVKSTNRDCMVRLNGKSFANSYSQIIFDKLTNALITPTSEIIIPKKTGLHIIEMYNRNIMSPNDIGTKEDNRRLGFGLEGISVTC